MKLTLFVGGGITGLTREHNIDVNSLDEDTRMALIIIFTAVNLLHQRILMNTGI